MNLSKVFTHKNNRTVTTLYVYNYVLVYYSHNIDENFYSNSQRNNNKLKWE